MRIFHAAGAEPGPALLFLGGVHGEEKPGQRALERLHGDLRAGRVTLRRGTLALAPRVNAEAAARGTHFVDENLNRIVRRHEDPRTHEQALANALLPLLDAADAVLDLHGTPAPTVPFAFLDDESPANRAWAESLGAPYVLTGWPALYAGGTGSTTTEYAQGRGKLALTVEAGQNDDASAVEEAYAFALRSLAHFGLIPALPAPAEPRTLRLERVIRRERAGAFARPWRNFDEVKKGEILARLGDGADVAAPEDGFVVMPYDSAEIGEEWLYLARPETPRP